MRPLRFLAFMSLLLSLTACGSLQEQYVAADVSTYEVIAPAHKAYVEADATMTDEQKARRLRKLASWQARIEEGRRAAE